MSALENEVSHPTTTFDHFDRTWTVPTQRHLSHIKAMRDAMREGVGTLSLLVAETFLDEDQFDELLKLDPAEPELTEFTEKISKALGTGSQGNSEPSSASS